MSSEKIFKKPSKVATLISTGLAALGIMSTDVGAKGTREESAQQVSENLTRLREQTREIRRELYAMQEVIFENQEGFNDFLSAHNYLIQENDQDKILDSLITFLYELEGQTKNSEINKGAIRKITLEFLEKMNTLDKLFFKYGTPNELFDIMLKGKITDENSLNSQKNLLKTVKENVEGLKKFFPLTTVIVDPQTSAEEKKYVFPKIDNLQINETIFRVMNYFLFIKDMQKANPAQK